MLNRFALIRPCKIAAFLVLALAGIGQLRAQAPSRGVLGERYADVNFDVNDYPSLRRSGNGTGISLNLPANPNLDIGLGYAYGWIDLSDVKVSDHAVNAAVVWHGVVARGKPFLAGSVGYDWHRGRGNHVHVDDRMGLWSISTGMEFTAGDFALTPTISYSDITRRHTIGAMHYGAEANYWFTSRAAGYAAVIFTDFNGRNGSCWTYRTGVRVRF